MRPTHIEDYLISLYEGQWFGWSDSKNKIYSNLIIHDSSKSKPSEADCTNGLKALQDSWDTENATYKLNRAKSYKSIKDQLDLLYHDMTAGKGDNTGEWYKHIKAIKDANPKG
mgnify:CR=1 FL=1|jgi:hypothetical protein|tara:strand:- start:292 stop:630 length:339 start_codon:yes stop_codon:yes gene_type:complete